VAARELVQKAIEAHGGAERYAAAAAIRVRVRSGGWAFVMRFQRGALADFTGTVSTAEPHTVLSPYPKRGQRGLFERERVWIESDDGDVIAERANPRAAFHGLRHNIWWDDLDLLHFAGYALWNYIAAPFMFTRPGFELEEREPWEENGELWRRLHVVFPDDIPTHSREQDFYFDDEGLLRRLDYTAEVFGSWAKAAHYCWDHERFSGLVVSTRRLAAPRRRNGRALEQVKIVWLRFGDVVLVPRASA
jgi:hypothetical protein